MTSRHQTKQTEQARLGPASGRTVRADHCPTCGALIWTGLDADHGAQRARTDPTPLSAAGELLALLQGRTTYLARRHGKGVALTRRGQLDPGEYQRKTPRIGWPAYDIVTDHICHQPPLPSLPSQLARTSHKTPDQPPF